MRQALIVTLSVVVVGIVIVGIAWAFWPATIDTQVVKVQQLQQELFQQSASVTGEQRREMFERLRGEMDQLTDQQREQVRREAFAGFRDRMAEDVAQFHKLPLEQRKAYLDERIDQMESRRQQGGFGRGPARQAGGPGAGNQAAPGAGAPWGGRPGGPPNLTDEQREQRRRQRLDNSTARERAEFVAFFEALRERRKERGLPDFGPPRR